MILQVTFAPQAAALGVYQQNGALNSAFYYLSNKTCSNTPQLCKHFTVPTASEWGKCSKNISCARLEPVFSLLSPNTPDSCHASASAKIKYKSLTVTASEATHRTIRAKQSWLSTTNVAVIICKDGRTGLVLQGQRQPCCSSFLLLFTASNQGKRGSECGRTTRRTVGQRFTVEATHTPSPRTERQRRQTGFGLSLSAAASLPAPAPPPPHRPSAGERQKRNERSGVVYLCAD